jgi:hypothetical protein
MPNLRLSEGLRVFGQLESSLEDGRNGGPRQTDLDRLDVNQLFAGCCGARVRAVRATSGRSPLSS